MSHRTLRSAAVVLLASAPLFAATPAQAASQQGFPCAVGIQKINSTLSSAVTVSLLCAESRTVDVRVTADGTEILSLRQTVHADVRQTVTVTGPRVQQVCATLQTAAESTTICTP